MRMDDFNKSISFSATNGYCCTAKFPYSIVRFYSSAVRRVPSLSSASIFSSLLTLKIVGEN